MSQQCPWLRHAQPHFSRSVGVGNIFIQAHRLIVGRWRLWGSYYSPRRIPRGLALGVVGSAPFVRLGPLPWEWARPEGTKEGKELPFLLVPACGSRAFAPLHLPWGPTGSDSLVGKQVGLGRGSSILVVGHLYRWGKGVSYAWITIPLPQPPAGSTGQPGAPNPCTRTTIRGGCSGKNSSTH